MNAITVPIDGAAPAVRPFVALMRERLLPALEKRRGDLESMYAPVIGRPETDPVPLAAVTVPQIMMRLPDRACAEAFLYDARWRFALGDFPRFHPTTLVVFRNRLAENGKARLALDACLEAMREAGYLTRRSVRIDSTHLLGRIAAMSRLECVRETLRLALDFLSAFGGAGAWEPWGSRYGDRNPEELRKASPAGLAARMDAAGADMRDLLARADALGGAVAGAEPVALLRRVFCEQFELRDGAPVQRRASEAGAVINPHDSDVQWSTKKTLGKGGWHGYKAQVCETAEGGVRARGEPTKAVVTAILVQPATASDHGSVPATLAEHAAAAAPGRPPPDEVFADAGYLSAPALLRAQADGYELVGPMPDPPQGGDRFGTDSFKVDLPARKAVCPSGNASLECDRIDDAKFGVRYYFAWPAKTCAACPLRERCVSKQNKLARRTNRGDRQPHGRSAAARPLQDAPVPRAPPQAQRRRGYPQRAGPGLRPAAVQVQRPPQNRPPVPIHGGCVQPAALGAPPVPRGAQKNVKGPEGGSGPAGTTRKSDTTRKPETDGKYDRRLDPALHEPHNDC